MCYCLCVFFLLIVATNNYSLYEYSIEEVAINGIFCPRHIRNTSVNSPPIIPHRGRKRKALPSPNNEDVAVILNDTTIPITAIDTNIDTTTSTTITNNSYTSSTTSDITIVSKEDDEYEENVDKKQKINNIKDQEKTKGIEEEEKDKDNDEGNEKQYQEENDDLCNEDESKLNDDNDNGLDSIIKAMMMEEKEKEKEREFLKLPISPSLNLSTVILQYQYLYP